MGARRRFRFPVARGGGAAFLAAAVVLTLVWLLARSLAPAGGLTRSYHYPLPRDADPLALDVRDLPAIEEAAAGVDLDFLDPLGRPGRNYFVRWRGVWFSPRAEQFDLWAGADDGVVVRVDGRVVLERHPAVGMHGESRSVALAPGAHALEIDHWQRAGGRGLRVQWAPAGGEPEALDAGRLFPVDPGLLGYWLRAAAERMPPLVLLVWAACPAVLLAGWVRRRAAALTGAEAGRRLRAAALPALLAPSQVLLFGPWTVHATNRAEFLAPFWSLALPWLGLLALVAGGLAALGLLLSARGFRCYVAGLCAAGVLLWLQGNLLVADYGLLDGGGLDLAPHRWRAPLEAGLWVAALALAVAAAGPARRAAPTASALLMALEAAVLLVPGAAPATRSTGSGSAPAETWRLPPPAIYELSSTRNVFLIVLDMFTSHVFADLARAEPARFDRDWAGFTYYPDHLGALRRTDGSIPAMLTGAAFRNEVPFRQYRARHATIFEALGREGYRLRSLTAIPSVGHPDPSRPGAEDAIRYTIPSPYSGYRDYRAAARAQLLDLSLFRHAPHGLKRHVYREQQWLLQARHARRPDAAARAERPIGNLAFLTEFTERLHAGGDAPVYTFLHLVTPHPPLVTEADCTYSGRPRPHTPESYAAQARCALAALEALWERLRALGLYDRSGIVVTADHGWDVMRPADHPLRGLETPAGPLDGIAADATPLLLVKPAGARGPLRISGAPTTITDVPATLLDLADLPNTLRRGTSALSLDAAAPRPRTYATHNGESTWRRPYYDLLHVFAVDGRVTDPASWRYRRAVFEPTGDPAAQRRAHRVGLAEAPDAASAGAGSSTYWTGPYAAFFVPADTGRVAFDVRKAPDVAAQTMTVRVDGEVVGRHTLGDDAWRNLAYAVEARDAVHSPFCVELRVDPPWRDGDHRPRGVLLRGDL